MYNLLIGIPVNIKTEEDVYNVEAYLPGVKKENINVKFKEGILTIEANRDETDSYNEMQRGPLRRILRMKDIDFKNSSAELREGVLYLTLPHQEKVEILKIT